MIFPFNNTKKGEESEALLLFTFFFCLNSTAAPHSFVRRVLINYRNTLWCVFEERARACVLFMQRSKLERTRQGEKRISDLRRWFRFTSKVKFDSTYSVFCMRESGVVERRVSNFPPFLLLIGNIHTNIRWCGRLVVWASGHIEFIDTENVVLTSHTSIYNVMKIKGKATSRFLFS